MNSSARTSTPDSQTIRYELLDRPEQLPAIADFLAGIFPAATHLSVPYLNWQYFQNPAGRAIACTGVLESKIVSHFAIQPVRCRLKGEPVTAGIALNVGTRPDLRQRGLLRHTGLGAIEAAKQADLRLLAAVTNAQSTRGFVGRLGFRLACQLEARIGLGAAPDPGTPATPMGQTEFRIEKDAEFLNWRLSRPGAEYYTNDSSARCQRIFRRTYRFPLAPVIELARIERQQLSYPLPQRSRTSPFVLWLGLSPGRRWSATSFFALPERLKPSPLNFVYRDLRDENSVLSPQGIEIDGLDLDAF